MKNTSLLRHALTAILIAVATFTISSVRAECGGCGGKKDCPAPSPSPSPAK